MVSGQLKKSFHILKYLSQIKNPSKRRKLLEILASDNDLFDASKEIAINLIEGNINILRKYKKTLQKHRKLIQTLAAQKSKKNKKKLIVQSREILPFLIPAAGTALGAILKDVIFS